MPWSLCRSYFKCAILAEFLLADREGLLELGVHFVHLGFDGQPDCSLAGLQLGEGDAVLLHREVFLVAHILSHIGDLYEAQYDAYGA